MACADSEIQTLFAMEEQLPGTVLTGLQRPEMNGLELVDVIRKKYPLTPVFLVLTVHTMPNTVQSRCDFLGKFSLIVYKFVNNGVTNCGKWLYYNSKTPGFQAVRGVNGYFW